MPPRSASTPPSSPVVLSSARHPRDRRAPLRRADRLFQIIQLLRARPLSTAARLAEVLEVSTRTIYRDIQDLVASGVPIRGEAGVGYALPASFDLPPLMFTAQELEALVAGARIVRSWGDRELARAARGALDKVEAVLPDALRQRLRATALYAPDFHVSPATAQHLGPLRQALSEGRRLTLRYRDGKGQTTSRTVRPLGLFFWGTTWSLVAWCALRDDFRNFRVDRIQSCALGELDSPRPGQDLEAFLARMSAPA